MPSVSFTVNGRSRRIDAPPEETLLSVLRNRLDLTGAKYGCGEGQCGACMVLVDGAAVPACQTTLAEAAGKRIVTIEGLAMKDHLHPVQAFSRDPVVRRSSYDFRRGSFTVPAWTTNPSQSRRDIGLLARNVCRCGTYPRILAAVQAAAKKGRRREGSDETPAPSLPSTRSRSSTG
jgi:aerobic-type carbon monoxide dehydrogenase small subunit (CoxS/CutS family)